MISQAILRHNAVCPEAPVSEEILHTGQHYDEEMSQVFFEEMKIPTPVVNLDVGSGFHGFTTGRMLEGIEREIMSREPDWVVVYGDTNSSLAGALAAAKLHVPVIHIEAGLRSFNKRMAEEINRILVDHLSTLLLCPTQTAVANLAKEGIRRGVHHVGDVMCDAAIQFGELAERKSTVLQRLGLSPKAYLLATIHRAENADNPGRMSNIMAAFYELARTTPLVFPMHPRTRNKLREFGILPSGVSSDQPLTTTHLLFIGPVPFLDMVQLEKHARCILTDSGGVQKEAYFHAVPCVTLREETEWPETVSAGWNQVVGANAQLITAAVHNASAGVPITEYGTGHSASDILALMCSALRPQ